MGSTSSVTTGAASSPGTPLRDDGAADDPRLRTLTVVSTPHPVPFRAAMHSGGDQRERSSYMDWFRSPDAEAGWLADDGALLAAAHGEHPADARRSTGASSPPTAAPRSRAASTGTAPTRSRPPTGRITAPTLYVWSTGDVALGREAAEGTGAEVQGPYRFEVLDDVSHWIPEVAADALNPLLLEHLAAF